MPTDHAIEAEGLIKRYGETLALAGVDLDVPQGTVCALLGPNGAGKTTAVRILTTLCRPRRRQRRERGSASTSPTRSRCAAASGLAAQDATVDGLLTGHENLVMIGELHHLGRKAAKVRADELLEQFSLADAARSVAKRLLGRHAAAPRPGGDAGRPPGGAVPRRADDRAGPAGAQLSCGTCSTTWSPAASTILLTTQYLEEADRLADEIVVVDHGRVIARGDSRSLKRQVGGDQLHVVVGRRSTCPRAAEAVEKVSWRPATVDAEARSVTAPTTERRRRGRPSWPTRWRATTSRSRTWGCASPPWTTCS